MFDIFSLIILFSIFILIIAIFCIENYFKKQYKIKEKNAVIQDLTYLILKEQPSSNLVYEIKNLGSYNLDYGWKWNIDELKELSYKKLLSLYSKLKESKIL